MNRISLFTLFSLITFSVIAGWEDLPDRTQTSASAVSKTGTAVKTSSSEVIPKSAPKVGATYQSGQLYGNNPNRQLQKTNSKALADFSEFDVYAPHIDYTRKHDNYYRFYYYTPKEVGENSISSADIEFSFLLADFKNVLGSDIRLSLDPGVRFFIDDFNNDIIPGVLATLPLSVGVSWRFINNWSLELGAAPGIYGDVEAIGSDMFSIPFSGCLYFALAPEISFKAGVEIRPGWEQVAMPLAGLAWQPADSVYLEFGVPRSMLLLKSGFISLFGKAEWENKTYVMEGEKASDEKGSTFLSPESVTFDAWRIGGGLAIDFSDRFRMSFEAGYMLGQELEFKLGDKTETGEYDSPYFGVTISTSL